MIGNIIFGTIMVGILAVLIYGLFRIPHVHKFRLAVIDLCYIWTVNHMDECGLDQEKWAFFWCFKKMPEMENMVFSFKRMKLESWLSQADIDKLLSDPETKEAANFI